MNTAKLIIGLSLAALAVGCAGGPPGAPTNEEQPGNTDTDTGNDNDNDNNDQEEKSSVMVDVDTCLFLRDQPGCDHAQETCQNGAGNCYPTEPYVGKICMTAFATGSLVREDVDPGSMNDPASVNPASLCPTTGCLQGWHEIELDDGSGAGWACKDFLEVTSPDGTTVTARRSFDDLPDGPRG